MGLCGSFRCGCGVTSTPATEGAINGELPTIFVSGSGEPGDPYDLSLNDAWAEQVASLGVKAFVIRTTPQAGITGATDLTSMTATWTADAARRYRVTAQVTFAASLADASANLYISNSINTLLQSGATQLRITGGAGTIHMDYYTSGVSGSQTVKLRAESSTAASLTANGSATSPMVLIVEDIGPV